MKQRLIIAGIVGVGSTLTLMGLVALDYAFTPRLVDGPFVHRTTPDGFEITWQIHPQASASVVVEGPAGERLGRFPAQRNAAGCHACITGLAADREYRYTLVAEPRPGQTLRLGQYATRTAPEDERALRFLALGDTAGLRHPAHVIAGQLRGFDFDLAVHTGDLLAPRDWQKPLPRYPLRLFAPLFARTPLYPAWGNHDVRSDNAPRARALFPVPQTGPAASQPTATTPATSPSGHYWFDFGPVRFVAIDTNHDEAHFRSVVAPWLDRVLADAGDRWTIVFGHEPIYTTGRHPPARKLQHTLAPVLDRHGVPLVLSGHNQFYERSYPLRAGRIVPSGQGTVYVTTGAISGRLYDARTPAPAYTAVFNDQLASFTVVDVTADVMIVRQMSPGRRTRIEWRVLDEFPIPRRPNAPATQPSVVTVSHQE